MKLLIVDDEVDLCASLRDHFEEHFEGEVFTATTPGEALRLLEQLQPEGMLLDINLRSRLNGFDVLSRAAEISP
jgi:DNA-binding response OmpR family regulator